MKSAGCDDVNPHFITNYTCVLKPTRNGNGLTTFIAYDLKPVDDIWLGVKIFYKYGTVFRPWQINWDIDWCAFMENKIAAVPFFQSLVDTMQTLAPYVFHQCPYEGPAGVQSVNLASMLENTVPQVIPTGTYKARVRIYRKKENTTYAILWGIGEVKAVEIMKSMDMGK